MAANNESSAAVYELPLPAGPPAAAGEADGHARLPETLLLKNVLWFCHLRWAVVAILGTFGLLGLFPQVLAHVGLRPTADWPLVAAGILVAGNLAFSGHARLLKESGVPRYAHINLWGQIVFDLVVLTGVVHYAGSLETNITFAYLFHIVLACIFLSGTESLAVTLIACVLYMAVLAAEDAGLVAPQTLFAGAPPRLPIAAEPWIPIWNLALALFIWLAVWYLTSHLAAMVRARDEELGETNRRLEAALEERSRHMLRTTHELKAPFAAIHATTQLLLDGQCGPLPDEARAFVQRISTRCRRLANEIQEMVQLANLRSESQGTLPHAALDVAEILRGCIGQVKPLAEERKVIIEADLAQARTVGVEEHLKMLFANLLGNAVGYSYEGGRVRVRCRPGEGGGPEVVIEDHGIGIPADKLPRVFDEYYRTDEAVRHNKQSSGLGLAIVRHVAEEHGIRIRVESCPGAGTTFHLRLAVEREPSEPDSENKENHDGLRADCR